MSYSVVIFKYDIQPSLFFVHGICDKEGLCSLYECSGLQFAGNSNKKIAVLL